MLPSSVRRVVAAPQAPILSSLASSTSSRAAAGVAAFPYNPTYQHRRRYSSSKPSSPNDSPKGIPSGQVTANPSSSTKQSGEKRRRKTKDEQKLPSVPSTQHVPQEAMALSTFFSLHRPMSVTHSFPKVVTDDAFAQIFASRAKNTKSDEVVSTLSRTVEDLENPMQALDLGSQEDGTMDHNGDRLQKIELRHPDGSESGVFMQLNAMSGQFLPFRPPPLPATGSGAAAEEIISEEAQVEATPDHRVYKAVFTLEETTDSNGEVRIMAHSPELIEEDSAPRTFLERMARRQLRRQEARDEEPGMIAISVKRQRRLKMKKKKLKQLRKRTRNERRKLDRV